MRNFKRRITHLACLFSEYCAEQPFLCAKLGFALGRNLSDKNVACGNLCTYADNTSFVKVAERVLADIRNITCDFLRSELGIAGCNLVFLNMNGCKYILLNKSFVYKHSVLVVVTFPCHKSDKNVTSESDFAVLSRRTVGYDVARLNSFALFYYRTLVNAHTLVGACEFNQFISVCLAAVCLYLNLTRGNL